MIELLKSLYPLHRTMNHDDNIFALNHISDFIGCDDFKVLEYKADSNVLDWKVPRRFKVNHAYLKDEDDNILIDFDDNVLHLVNYSVSINKTLEFDELNDYLHYDENNIDSIPWVYRYYDQTWGFCLSKNQYDKLNRNIKYKVDISTSFEDKPMVIGELLLKGTFDQEILVVVDICHPNQVNDSISGAVIAAEIAKQFKDIKLMNSIRFLFVPESIGTIAWLSNNLDKNVLYALTFDCLGNNNILKFQHTLYSDSYIDNIARSKQNIKYELAAFREYMANDELYLSAPGIDIPSASFTRAPFKEYHTSSDNPDNIDEIILLNTLDIIKNIILETALDYIPKQKISGFIFLSKYDLWNTEDQTKPYYLKKVFQLLNGNHSVLEIANLLEIDYFELHEIFAKIFELNLIEKLAVNRTVHKQPIIK